MMVVIFLLTVRQIAGQKRTLLMLLFAALPVAIAIIYRISADEVDRVEFVANGLLSGLVVAIVLPLTALIFGTAALGAEIEDGTVVYLLAKPIPRWRIIVPKLLAAWIATAALVFIAAAVAGTIAIAGEPGASVVPAFAIAVVIGAFVYCCGFIMLSVLTSRALIVGLIYVFLWEAVVNGLFKGTRFLSVRQTTLGIADALTNVSKLDFEARISGGTAAMLMVIAIGVTLYVATRRLSRFEIGEST
jgi:ABC-2 type transport system permease protein